MHNIISYYNNYITVQYYIYYHLLHYNREHTYNCGEAGLNSHAPPKLAMVIITQSNYSTWMYSLLR